MNTYQRSKIYLRSGRGLTGARRRRLVKKAGREVGATVVRNDQGYRELIGFDSSEAWEPPPGLEPM